MKWIKASIKPPTGNAEDYSWRRVKDKKKFNPVLNINGNVLEYEWLRSEWPFDEVEYLDETEPDTGEIETLKAENSKMRQALEMIRDGFDHESDAHRYQNLNACPVCIATEVLRTT